MKLVKKGTIIFLLIVCSVYNYDFSATNILGYTRHDPISISDDSEFAAVAVSGDGSITNPWILEGWEINTKTEAIGISIVGTTDYFCIRNCHIETTEDGYGIYISQVTSGTGNITGNVCKKNFWGIYLYDADYTIIKDNQINQNFYYGLFEQYSDNILIQNNFFTENFVSLYLRDSNTVSIIGNSFTSQRYGISGFNNQGLIIEDNQYLDGYYGIYLTVNPLSNIISNNTIKNFQWYGIYLGGSCNGSSITENLLINIAERAIYTFGNYIQVINNSIQNCKYGITLQGAAHGVIKNNTCFGNEEYGLKIVTSPDITISLNKFQGKGIIIEEEEASNYKLYNCSNNTVNGLAYGYYSDNQNINITEPHSQLFLGNCSNVRIKNQKFSSVESGIDLFHCSAIEISNCTFTNIASYGVNGFYSTNLTIFNNTITGDSSIFATGLYIRSAENSTIENNTFNYIYRGIYFYFGDDSKINNNYCLNSNYGIEVMYTNRTEVNHNFCQNISYYGMVLYRIGITEVRNNTCIDNPSVGMKIYDSGDATFKDNIFWNSGVDIQGSSYENYNVINNLINGKPLGIFANKNNFTITGQYGQLVLVNCTYGKIENVTITNTTSGIILRDSSYINISNSLLSGCFRNGIDIESSHSLIISRNVFLRNNRGFELRLVKFSSILNNIFINNRYQAIYSSTSNFNDIHHNSFIDNNNGYNQSYCVSGVGNVWTDQVSGDGNYYWPGYNGTSKVIIGGNEGVIDTNPLTTSDFDSDSMPDGWEYIQGLNLLINDALNDNDDDNLTNLEELNAGTNVTNQDSDYDGFTDSFELSEGTNPMDDSDYPQISQTTSTESSEPISTTSSTSLAPQESTNLPSSISFILILSLFVVFLRKRRSFI